MKDLLVEDKIQNCFKPKRPVQQP